MNLNSDSIKLIKNWLLKVPLDELRKKISECECQPDKEWWERIYKLAVQKRKECEDYNGKQKIDVASALRMEKDSKTSVGLYDWS
ncbi:hypothetical protein IMSAG044_00260 [Lactobacillaceae bacterium]|uniref:hypothetical protein n=1 Tax=uncultured Limosilactobacillus sp. TaxID=2837629 RepID=UPI0014342FD6|nr:hypothetical protein [uncultured Limosilactobacillus sp.]GFI59378.1 hypothetical protein IMSAG044_00260 [Lactobacillaceae bacterium]